MFDRGTIKLATIAGIPVRLHWSFGFIFIWVGYNAWIEKLPFSSFLFLQSYVLIIFFCVLLHEFGHSLTAKRFGNKTRDILLTPIGGIARLESISEKPAQELLIAIAGPAVNVGIAGVIALILYFTGQLSWDTISSASNLTAKNILPLVMLSNIILAVFNFIPAFPMDGGRVLRALLSFKWSRYKATLIAARLGQLCAITFLYYALSNQQWMLTLVSVFIFFTAGSELKQIRWETILDAHTAQELSNPITEKIQTFSPSSPLIQEAKTGLEKNYLIFNGHQLVGHIPYHRLLYCIKNKINDKTIYEIQNHQTLEIEKNETLKSIYHQMQIKGIPIAAVIEEGQVIGMIEDHQIKRFVEMHINEEI